MAPGPCPWSACCVLRARSLSARPWLGCTAGLDGTRGVLISDTSLEEHVVEVDVQGPAPAAGDASTAGGGVKPFRVLTTRTNPAAAGTMIALSRRARVGSGLVGSGRVWSIASHLDGQ